MCVSLRVCPIHKTHINIVLFHSASFRFYPDGFFLSVKRLSLFNLWLEIVPLLLTSALTRSRTSHHCARPVFPDCALFLVFCHSCRFESCRVLPLFVSISFSFFLVIFANFFCFRSGAFCSVLFIRKTRVKAAAQFSSLANPPSLRPSINV